MKKITFVLSLLISTLGFGQNLIVNGDFESGVTDGTAAESWKGFKNQIVTTDDINATKVGNINNGDGSLTQVFAVTAGKTYKANFEYRWVGEGGTGMTARIKSGASAGDDLTTFVLNKTTDIWHTSSGDLTFTVAAGITEARVIFYKVNGNRPLRLDNISITELSATASVADFKQFNFSHYPNPTTNNLNLSASKNIESVKVFNLLGQNLISVNPNTIKTSIDVSALNKGIYIMNATIDGKKASFKFIKK